MAIIWTFLSLGCAEDIQYAKRVGVFEFTEHWARYGWALEGSKQSFLKYMEMCNIVTGDCFVRGVIPGKRGNAELRFSFSDDKSLVFIYADNVNWVSYERPIVSFYGTVSGQEFSCGHDIQVPIDHRPNDVAFRWKGRHGLLQLIRVLPDGSLMRQFHYVSIDEGSCRLISLEEIPRPKGNYRSGPANFDPSIRTIAWPECEDEECRVMVVDVLTSRRYAVPSRFCGSPLAPGTIRWTNGKLFQVCDDADDVLVQLRN